MQVSFRRVGNLVLRGSLPDKKPSPCLSFSPDDTVGDLKKLIAAQTGTAPEKIILKKWHTIYKDHITLDDYEIHDGMSLELYYS